VSNKKKWRDIITSSDPNGYIDWVGSDCSWGQQQKGVATVVPAKSAWTRMMDLMRESQFESLQEAGIIQGSK
jgi:hypothetical protein